ncbi:hypothetical protein CYY_001760 [Polysphondylium violaceum]|uniref:MRH domain-containing protein n=1 Tax=Polysphondylium violaceum TaxID=133409 RepID=A0A8J4V7K2_9MYCE|nr:hypothetical protein CYY_001760 [Polysphondylium violaceum]
MFYKLSLCLLFLIFLGNCNASLTPTDCVFVDGPYKYDLTNLTGKTWSYSDGPDSVDYYFSICGPSSICTNLNNNVPSSVCKITTNQFIELGETSTGKFIDNTIQGQGTILRYFTTSTICSGLPTFVFINFDCQPGQPNIVTGVQDSNPCQIQIYVSGESSCPFAN